MYSTCIFCHAPFGANAAVEHFRVGRRLAFDSAKGRLWVVCRKCERWNLSPLEERWEAVEECERLFRSTRLRLSTENIGLARMKEGLELVRIGEPQRPEFAAWRYGDQFGRRRRRRLIQTGLGIGAVGAAVFGGVAAGVGLVGFAYLTLYAVTALPSDRHREVARVHTACGELIPIQYADLRYVRILEGRGVAAWSLLIPDTAALTGESALGAAAAVLPLVNRRGGSQRTVQAAVTFLERGRHPLDSFRGAARGNPRFAECPRPVRLALEMAAHEEEERVAMKGELARLERAWKEAEEIAAISDRLLVPSAVEDLLSQMRITH